MRAHDARTYHIIIIIIMYAASGQSYAYMLIDECATSSLGEGAVDGGHSNTQGLDTSRRA